MNFFSNLRRADGGSILLAILIGAVILIFILGITAIICDAVVSSKEKAVWEWEPAEKPTSGNHAEIISIDGYDVNKDQMWSWNRHGFNDDYYKVKLKFEDKHGIVKIAKKKIYDVKGLTNNFDSFPWIPIYYNSRRVSKDIVELSVHCLGTEFDVVEAYHE